MEIVKKIDEKDRELTYVIGFFSDEAVKESKYLNKVNELLKHKSLKKDLASVNVFHLLDEGYPETIYLVSLGKRKDYKLESLFKVLIEIAAKASEKNLVEIDSFVGDLDHDEVVKNFVLYYHYYSYVYDECKSKKSDKKVSVHFLSKINNDAIINEYFVLANAISNARDLINKPYNYLSASDLANYAMDLAQENPSIKCEVYDNNDIEKLKMGAFLGVNKGSYEGAKLIYMTYNGAGDSEYIGLVGKGLMFDTGGYDIKSSMNSMKNDMSGAATVLALIEALAKNEIKINVKLVICATDNRIDGKALLPDDVLTSMKGLTIEIVSTDAEGRLTLADALTYIQRQGVKTVIDLATLTGAVVVALGEYTTGIFGNDKKLINNIINAGLKENEDIWELPITEHIRGKVRSSKVADLTNSTGRLMGASGAAAFLEEFVEEGTSWVHLDIAGTAFQSSPAYKEHYGASGIMVKSLYHVLKNFK